MTVPSTALGINSPTLASPPVINIFVVQQPSPVASTSASSPVGALNTMATNSLANSGLGFAVQLARALPPPAPPPQPTVQESFSQLGDMIGVLTTMNTVLGSLLTKTEETAAPASATVAAPVAPASTAAAPIPISIAATPVPAAVPASNAGLTLPNQTQDATQKARLDATLAKVAQDPDGAKLLAAAKAAGYTIEVGDPTVAAAGAHDVSTCPICQAALDAGLTVNGVTIPSQKKIVVNPNAPNFDKTVVHELVHASTEGDGDSQTEEGLADVIGFRVASRIDGTAPPATDQQIFSQKILSYLELNKNNPILASLAALGIQAPNFSA
jgi:hypothetical protein